MLNLVIWIPQFLRTICFFSFSTVKASLNPSLVLSFLGTQRPGWPPTFIHCSFWGGFEPQQAQQGFGVQRAKLKRIFSPLLYQPEPRRTLHTRFDTARLETLLVKSTQYRILFEYVGKVRSSASVLALLRHAGSTAYFHNGIKSVVRIYMKNVYIRDLWRPDIHEKCLYTRFLTQNVVLSLPSL